MNLSISGVGGTGSPQIYSGASTQAPPLTKMSNLFQQIDTSNSGSISLNQLQQAFDTLNPPANFQALGAAATFQQLDPAGTGSVSKADFVSGMTGLMRSLNSPQASSTTDAAAASSSPDTPAFSLSRSLQAFLQLGSQAASVNNGVGNILDAQV